MPISYIHTLILLVLGASFARVMRIVWLNRAHHWKNRPASMFQSTSVNVPIDQRRFFSRCGPPFR